MFNDCSLLSVNLLIFICSTVSTVSAVFFEQPAADFSKHSIVQPVVQHSRTKRQIDTTRDEIGSHHLEVIMAIVVNDEEYILDLQLNQDLVTDNHVLGYQKKGKTILYKPRKEEIDFCHYSGSVRGKPNSWVALSTCHGVQGVVFDGTKMRYIEPAQGGNISSKHYMYDHEDLSKSYQCGHVSNMTENLTPNYYAQQSQKYAHKNTTNRFKRYASDNIKIHGPYNANKRSRYVELVLVADNREFRANRNDVYAVYRRMKTLANIVNSIYSPLNIFIALVGVLVWSERDEIQLDPDGDKTLDSFLEYRERVLVKDMPNDNAHLITQQIFLKGIIGKATMNGICSYHSSGGVENMHSSVMGLVASTIAHEMGHNFGMKHDTDDLCECPDQKCIMSPSSTTSITPVRWSSCSLNSLALSFGKGNDYCLSNKPKRLFYSSMCGNGFVEPGEECDCGSMVVAGSYNPCHACCEPSTCKRRTNATCGAGECCDLLTCRPKSAGTECRSAERECDLAEYCTGHSEYCPDDVYKMDTTPCGQGKESAYCISGKCRSHASQCRMLWGHTTENGHILCYELTNNKGNEYGHCGYHHRNDNYIPCKKEDVLCGMLMCFPLTQKTQIATKMTRLTHVILDDKVKVCHSADVSIQSDEANLGMVPDGAMCGDGKMCLKQKCVSVTDVRRKIANSISSHCPSNCSGHGICNSAGHCHCESGFAPPLCAEPGYGGSYESSTITDPADAIIVMIAIYTIFLGMVPLILLIIYLIHYFCPKTLVHCCETMGKLETYCKLNKSNKAHMYAKVNKEEYIEPGYKITNKRKSNVLLGQIEGVNQPIYANSQSISNYNDILMDKKKITKPVNKINKDDIQIVNENDPNIKSTSNSLYKDGVQKIRNVNNKDNINATKETINKKVMQTTSKKINKNEIQAIYMNTVNIPTLMDAKINKDNISNDSENIKGKDLKTIRKNTSKDDIHIVKKDTDSTRKVKSDTKNNREKVKEHITNVNKDLKVLKKENNKTDFQKATKKINKDSSSSSATRIIDKEHTPMLKTTRNEDSLSKDSKTGVSVKELASVINNLADNSQHGISNRRENDLKCKKTSHITKKHGLTK